MANMKMIFCLTLMITIITMTVGKPSRRSDKIYFQDSAETTGLDIDERASTQKRERNHRGRISVEQSSNNMPQFEQGIPGYPIRGPVQAPLVLPSSNLSDTTNTLVFATQPKVNQPQQQQPPKNYHYAGNPFLSKYTPASSVTPTTTTTNKFNPFLSTGVTNQLPSSDKPVTTTANPRLTNLLYGSNLLEEDANRAGQTVGTTDVNFPERGLFDTAPHCKPNEVLVNNKCRPKV